MEADGEFYLFIFSLHILFIIILALMVVSDSVTITHNGHRHTRTKAKKGIISLHMDSLRARWESSRWQPLPQTHTITTNNYI